MILSTNIGLELAGRALRIAVIQSRFGKLRLRRFTEISGFLDSTPEEQKRLALEAVKKLGVGPGRTFLTVPRDKGVVRQIEFPVEVADKLRSAVALQIESLCPWTADEIYWDMAAEAAIKGAKTVRITVAIAPRSEIDPWLEFFKSIGLPLQGAMLSPVAHAHGVRSLWPVSRPMIVLACEKNYVEAALIQGSKLSSVTQAGQETTAAAKTATEMLASTGRISGLEDVQIIAYGETAGTLEHAAPPPLTIEGAGSAGSRGFGAIASALAGVRKTPFAANLIPPALRYRRGALETVPAFVLIAAAILLGCAMLLREPYQMSVYAGQIDKEIERVAPAARRVSEQQTELNKLSERYRALSSRLQSRDYNLEALQELARILPSSAWLVSYSYQDGNIVLSGYADSASEIQRLLANSPLFKDVLPTAAVTRDKNKDKFTLKASIEVSQ